MIVLGLTIYKNGVILTCLFLVICHFIIGQLGNIAGIVYLPIAYDMLPVFGHVSTVLDFFFLNIFYFVGHLTDI